MHLFIWHFQTRSALDYARFGLTNRHCITISYIALAVQRDCEEATDPPMADVQLPRVGVWVPPHGSDGKMSRRAIRHHSGNRIETSVQCSSKVADDFSRSTANTLRLETPMTPSRSACQCRRTIVILFFGKLLSATYSHRSRPESSESIYLILCAATVESLPVTVLSYMRTMTPAGGAQVSYLLIRHQCYNF